MAAKISACYLMERKSVIVVTDMLYNRTGKHAKVAVLLINPERGWGRTVANPCNFWIGFCLEVFLGVDINFIGRREVEGEGGKDSFFFF